VFLDPVELPGTLYGCVTVMGDNGILGIRCVHDNGRGVVCVNVCGKVVDD
jgi:acyl dehydratase